MSAVSHRLVKWRGTVALVAVIVLAMSIAQTSTGHAVLRKAGLFEQPASYTSLAFHTPQSLPEQLSSQLANVVISFDIRNVSRTVLEYQWIILLTEGTASNRLSEGDVQILPGRGATITRTTLISCTQSRVRIAVTLTRPSESIDSWVSCTSSKADLPHR